MAALTTTPSQEPAEPPDIVVRPGAKRSVLTASALLYIIGTIGSNIGPAWVSKRPAVVLALSSRNRNLFASVPYFNNNWVLYGVIGFIRLLAAGVALFFLGRWFGRRAIAWTKAQVGELPAIYRWFQTGIDKAGWLMVVLMPGSNLVCLMAGYRRMRPTRFLTLLSVGIVIKLVVLWAGGKAFESQIRTALKAIEGYQWYIVGGLFLLTILQSVNKVRKGGPNVVQPLADEAKRIDGSVDVAADQS